MWLNAGLQGMSMPLLSLSSRLRISVLICQLLHSFTTAGIKPPLEKQDIIQRQILCLT